MNRPRGLGASARATLAGMMFSSVALSTAPSLAQSTAQPAAVAAGTSLDLNEYASRAITRLSLMDLRLHVPLQPLDFHIADALAEIAEQYMPGDPDLARLRVVFGDASGDRDALESALRRALKADPSDTAAQYRLITVRLGKVQLVEDRLKAFERFLGPDGAGLDRSIRSRLASDAAALLQERGDTAGFVDKIKLATSLDSTNKAAAFAALSYFDEHVDDPIARLDLIANLLYADIAEPKTHDELAHALASVGVFDGARRFSKIAQAIHDRAGLTQDANGFLAELANDWCIDGAAAVAQRLNLSLQTRREETTRLIAQLQEQLVPTNDIPKPEDVRLDARLDRVRLLAALTAGDAPTVETATLELKKSFESAALELDKMVVGGQLDAERLAEQRRALRLELISLLGVANVSTDSARADLDALASDPTNDAEDPAFLEAKGWMTLRGGSADDALRIFEPLAHDVSGASVGVATCFEVLGQREPAIAAYRGIVREFPITVEAAWSVGRLIDLTKAPELDPKLTSKARRFYDTLPVWLDAVAVDPAKFMSLTAEVTPLNAHNLERSQVHIRLSNTSNIPLAVGPGETIDSRSLVTPQLEIASEEVRTTSPEFLDLQHRLRLLPSQSIDITLWPDPGTTGWLIETNARDAARVRYRVIQGYLRGNQGEVVPGPMSLACGTRAMLRSPLAEAGLDASELAKRFADAPEPELPRLVVAARSQMFAVKNLQRSAESEAASKSAAVLPVESLLTPEQCALIAEAAAARYPKLSPVARAVVIASMPHSTQVYELKPLDDAIRAEADPTLLCLVLVSRVSDAADPVLIAAKTSGDPRLAHVAELLAERITLGKPAYAKLGPGFAGIISPPVTPPANPTGR